MKTRKIKIIAVLIVAVSLLAGGGVLAWGISTGWGKERSPVFAFDESVANGWWAADNHNAQEQVTEDYAGDEPIEKLPVAGRVIFQNKDTTADGCFVMYSYYDYATDTNALRVEKETQSTQGSEMSFERGLVLPASITTPEGDKTFDLHTYRITGPGSERVQRGMSLGYVNIDGGFIAINGVCPELEDIEGTVQAISAVSLE